uniref:ATP-dependent Clp protease proteolytic subunit n=1 Tax=Piliostigma thonningii TaxID=653098 RepID=A0A2S0SU09_9FABA|nr:clp protease proteolytic subunit [Piliostigma thonningii]AWB12958.1 clp protease proteolytic subunit [Piliostigma thonningii]
MPIGVPKTPFRIPGEEDATWVDLYNRLYRERLLFLSREVNSHVANQLMGLMVYLNMEDNTKDQFLFINSPGGWVIPGVGVYDTMQFVQADVQTVCVGLAASMASLILLGGETTKRIAFPHARVMIHQPASYFYDIQAGEFVIEASEVLKLRQKIVIVYARRTGKPFWLISEDLERDVFMSATDAKTHGIVDLVGLG